MGSLKLVPLMQGLFLAVALLGGCQGANSGRWIELLGPEGKPVPGVVISARSGSCLSDVQGRAWLVRERYELHKPGFQSAILLPDQVGPVRLATDDLEIACDERNGSVPWRPAPRSGVRVTSLATGSWSPSGGVLLAWARNGSDVGWREQVSRGHTLCLVVGTSAELGQDEQAVEGLLPGTGLELLPGVLASIKGELALPVRLKVGAELGLDSGVATLLRPGRLGVKAPARVLAATDERVWTIQDMPQPSLEGVSWVAGAGPLGAGKITILVASGPGLPGETAWDSALLEALVRY